MRQDVIHEVLWPIEDRDRLELALARVDRPPMASQEREGPPPSATPVTVPYVAAKDFLRSGAPLIAEVTYDDRKWLIGVRRYRRGRAECISMLGRLRWASESSVVAMMQEGVRRRVATSVLRPADPGGRGLSPGAVEDAILATALAYELLSPTWILRPAPSLRSRDWFKDRRLLGNLTAFALAHAAYQLCWISSWWILGRAALGAGGLGQEIIVWAFLLVVAGVFRGARVGLGVRLTTWAGVILRTAHMEQVVRQDPDAISELGVGQLFGRVVESRASETLAFSGGLALLMGGVELAFAGWVASQGLIGWGILALVGLIVGVGGMTLRRFRAELDRVAAARLRLTDQLVEGLIGIKTQRVQGSWTDHVRHADRRLAEYLTTMGRSDRLAASIGALPSLFASLAVLVLGAAMLAAGTPTVQVAVSVGGIVLLRQALTHLGSGAVGAVKASVSISQVESLWHSHRYSSGAGRKADAERKEQGSHGGFGARPLLSLTDVGFSYSSRIRPVFERFSLSVGRGSKTLVVGGSGSGKTTLAKIMTGALEPSHGTVLLDGMDLPTVGLRRWRAQSVLIPQAHENHIFLGTLAYNLLLGRGWPPSAQDLRDARDVCQALGLGGLLERMPSGLSQMVGEIGWRLSDGEKVRVFLARGILQRPDLMVVDEGLGALDGASRLEALDVLEKRVETMVLVTH